MTPNTGLNPAAQPNQGPAPATNPRDQPQYQAPPPPQVYYITIQQAVEIRTQLLGDGVVPANSIIVENSIDIGAPRTNPEVPGGSCFALKWNEPGLKYGTVKVMWEQLGILYHRMLEMQSQHERTGSPIPKWHRNAGGAVWNQDQLDQAAASNDS